MTKKIHKVGSVTFWLNHEHSDWASNGNEYSFDLNPTPDIAVRCVKHSNRTLKIAISGPFKKSYEFDMPVPETSANDHVPNGVYVALSWKDNTVDLFLQEGPAGSTSKPTSNKWN